MDGQGTTWRRNIAENFNRLSRVHERYRRQTDRQTDGPSMTYSEHELEFTFAKKHKTYLYARDDECSYFNWTLMMIDEYDRKFETIWNYFVRELMQRDSLELSYLTDFRMTTMQPDLSLPSCESSTILSSSAPVPMA